MSSDAISGVILEILVRSAAILAVGVGVGWAFRGSPASWRHRILAWSVLVALVWPILARVIPALEIPILPGPPPAEPLQRVDPIPRDGAPQPFPAFLWALVTGQILGCIRLAVDVGKARREVRNTRPCLSSEWIGTAKVVARDLGLKTIPTIVISDARRSPFVIGVFRQTLVLNKESLNHPFVEREALLRHELGHIRRGDLLIQRIARIACIAHWWNPLFHYASHRLRIERELACDALALDPGIRPSSYARLLLRSASTFSTQETALEASFGLQHHLGLRISTILKPDQHKREIRPHHIAGGSASVLLALVIGVATPVASRETFWPSPLKAGVLVSEGDASFVQSPAEVSSVEVIQGRSLSSPASTLPEGTGLPAAAAVITEPKAPTAEPSVVPIGVASPEEDRVGKTQDDALRPPPPAAGRRPRAKLRFVGAFVSFPILERTKSR